MQIEKLNDNCTFAYVPELEAIWGAVNLLIHDGKAPAPCAEIYGQDKISGWQKKYCFLFECFSAIKNNCPVNMLDFLLDFPIEHFSPERYRDFLLHLPAEDFIWRLLDLNRIEKADREEVSKALTDDTALDRLYCRAADDCTSFLAFSALLKQSNRLISEFFSLAADMRSSELSDLIKEREEAITQIAQTMREGIASSDPLDFSQEIMGKTFRNRGPYAEFVFLPSCLMPYRNIRFYHESGEQKRQILFLSLQKPDYSREDTIRTLKAMADGTRYQILTLLAREGPLRGLDISKRVSIAASTVSHHMEQLKEGALITEEQVKNSKYYGLNHVNTAAFLEELKKDLLT